MKHTTRLFHLLLALFFVLSILPLHGFARSPGSAETDQTGYNGYLVQLYEPVSVQLLEEQEGIETVIPETGLCWVDSFETAQAVIPEDAIRYIEPNYYVTLFDEPDDPRYEEQWSLDMIGITAAWAQELDGTGVRVGVIDSGLDAAHPDLAQSKIAAGYNYAEDSNDTTDTYGHGTFVSGVIAASTGNGEGIAGIADGAELVPLKCFLGKTTTIDTVVKALRGGVDEFHCDILNMSFGVPTESEALAEAVAYVQSQGVILVAAVGNDSSSTLNYPAAYAGVIGVGNLQKSKEISPSSQVNDSVFVVAPGTDVLGLALTSEEDLYRIGSGTSFACPVVIGVAALLKQAWPEMTSQQFMDLLQETSEDLGEGGYDTTYGYGLVSVPLLLKTLSQRQELTLVETADGLSVTGVCSLDPLDTQLWAVSYGESGKMLSCTPLSGTESDQGGIAIQYLLPLTDEIEQVKVFFFEKDTFRPIRPCAVWQAQRMNGAEE